jgi:FkbM family methyltransferase
MKKLHWSLLKRLYRLRGRFGVYERLDRLWLLDSRNWIDQQLMIRRPYEVAQIARCRQLVDQHRLEWFFDIGANFGLYTVLLSAETGLTQLHAFEPLPRNVHQLAANLYLNDLDNRVTLHNIALGDRAGKLALHVDPQSTGVSTLLPSESHRDRDAYQARIEVECRMFDELFSLAGVRALVKIDVEGAELLVLSGMRQFLQGNKVVLQVETTPQTLAPVDALLQQAGFRALGRLGADGYYGNL